VDLQVDSHRRKKDRSPEKKGRGPDKTRETVPENLLIVAYKKTHGEKKKNPGRTLEEIGPFKRPQRRRVGVGEYWETKANSYKWGKRFEPGFN